MKYSFEELDMSLDDFNQAFGQCIVRATHPEFNNETKIMYIDRAFRRHEDDDVEEEEQEDSYSTEDNKVVEGQWLGFSSLKKPKWLPCRLPIEDIKVQWEWPELGMINALGGAIYLSRKVNSGVYRKGVYTRLIDITDINSEEREILYDNSVIDINLVRPYYVDKIFKPQYYSPRDAGILVNRGKRLAAAISKNLAVSTHWWSHGLVLNYKGIPVGEMDTNGDAVHLFKGNEHLVQQISSYYSVV